MKRKKKIKKFTLRIEPFHKEEINLSAEDFYKRLEKIAIDNNDSVNQLINKQLQKLIK